VTVPAVRAGDEVSLSIDGAAPASLFVQPLIQDVNGSLKFRACALGTDVPAGNVTFSFGVIR
jgi:hypothetical protein